MPDRDKYIEVLSKAAKTVKEFNEDTPIKLSLECIEDILELLKEQNCNCCGTVFDVAYKAGKADAVVRCKDCKFWTAERINDYNKCKRWINVGVKNFATMGNWFCADGERKCESD